MPPLDNLAGFALRRLTHPAKLLAGLCIALGGLACSARSLIGA